MKVLHVDLTLVFIVLCVGVALMVILRFVDARASRAATEKTRRILQEQANSEVGTEGNRQGVT